MAPLKLASGCDRRCSFCAIPSFRGSFVSRRPSDVLHEARWLGEQGVKELFLVSENSTSYGKDLGDLRLLETLLPELAAVDGVERVRVSYLQPAETRPGLVTAIASTPGRRRLLRPVLPARLERRAPPDAPLRRPGELPRADRADPLAGAAGRHPLQRDRRLPRRDRGRPGHAVRLPGRRPDGRGRRVRLLRRGRHRGRVVRRQARRGRDPRAHRARHPAGRGAHLPARRGPDRRAGRGAPGVAGRRRRRGRGPCGPPGPGGRRYDDRGRSARGARVGDIVSALVVGLGRCGPRRRGCPRDRAAPSTSRPTGTSPTR